MKTWPQLTAFAARRKLTLYNTGGMVVLHRATGNRATIVSLQTGKTLTQDDGDRIARAAIEVAIRETAT